MDIGFIVSMVILYMMVGGLVGGNLMCTAHFRTGTKVLFGFVVTIAWPWYAIYHSYRLLCKWGNDVKQDFGGPML